MDQLPQLPGYLFEPSLAGIVSTVLTFVLPLLAALLMRQSWGTGLKGLLLLVLSAVKVILEAVIANANADGSFMFWPIFYGVFLNFLIAVAMHFGLYRGTSLQQTLINTGNTDADKRVVEGEVTS